MNLERHASSAAKKVSYTTPVYIIGGHGNDYLSSKPFKVPKGCMIVVKLEHGMLAYGDSMDAMIHNMNFIPKMYLQNPAKYASHIIRSIGSVAIYSEGQMCPNFTYYLNGCHEDTCPERRSGVLDFMRTGSDLKAGFGKDIDYDDLLINVKTFKDMCDVIANMYEHSVYPTKTDMYNVCLHIFKNMGVNDINTELNKNATHDYDSSISLLFLLFKNVLSRLEEFSDKNNTPIRITQEELCTKMTGVYYNFVCRANETHNQNVDDSNNNFQGFGKEYNTNPHVKNTRKKRIEEAIMHRRPYIRNRELAKIDDKIKENEDLIKFLKKGKEEHNAIEIEEIEEELIELKKARNSIRNTLNIPRVKKPEGGQRSTRKTHKTKKSKAKVKAKA